MKFLAFISIVLLIFGGCSNKDDTNPISTDKNSNKITTSKSGNTRIVKATLDFSNDPVYKSSLLEFRISVNQAGVFGIGENEPGFNYAVKAYYTLISRSGSVDKYHKAHYDNISTLTIGAISDKNLDADFLFNAVTDDSSSSVVFTNGAIQITY